MGRRSKFEIEIAYKTKRLHTIQACFGYGVLLVLGFFAIDAFRAIGLNAPDQVINLAKVVEALSLDRWILGTVAAVSSVAWKCERVGRKRAIKLKSKLQRQLEANDPNRTTSGLTQTGDTPEDEK